MRTQESVPRDPGSDKRYVLFRTLSGVRATLVLRSRGRIR
jgi:hypothetical protein